MVNDYGFLNRRLVPVPLYCRGKNRQQLRGDGDESHHWWDQLTELDQSVNRVNGVDHDVIGLLYFFGQPWLKFLAKRACYNKLKMCCWR